MYRPDFLFVSLIRKQCGTPHLIRAGKPREKYLDPWFVSRRQNGLIYRDDAGDGKILHGMMVFCQWSGTFLVTGTFRRQWVGSERLVSTTGEVETKKNIATREVETKINIDMMVRVAEYVLRFRDPTRRNSELKEIMDETGTYVPGPSIRLERPCAMHRVIKPEDLQIPSSDTNVEVFLAAVIFGLSGDNAYIVLSRRSGQTDDYCVIMDSRYTHRLFGNGAMFDARMRAVDKHLTSQDPDSALGKEPKRGRLFSEIERSLMRRLPLGNHLCVTLRVATLTEHGDVVYADAVTMTTLSTGMAVHVAPTLLFKEGGGS